MGPADRYPSVEFLNENLWLKSVKLNWNNCHLSTSWTPVDRLALSDAPELDALEIVIHQFDVLVVLNLIIKSCFTYWCPAMRMMSKFNNKCINS
jgi:hypothetical protein